jgi:hypothetical protein
VRVGHGGARLPVRVGEPMGGYADRVGGVGGELDPLEVHAVSWRAGERRFVLVVCDLICVNADLTELVRHRLGTAACWVAATHTHAGPDAGCRPGGGTTPPELARRVLAAVERAVAAARADEAPADGAVTRARVPRLASVRSRPAGGLDLPLDVLAVSRDGRLRGLVVVSPVHPTVLPAENLAASADLAGALRRSLDAPWAVVLTGAAGDISTRHTRRGRTPDELRRLGTRAAEAVHDALPTAVPAWSPGDTIGGPVGVELRLDARQPGDVTTPALGDPANRTGYVRRQGMRMADALREAGRTGPYRLRLEQVRLGAVRLVAIPAEPYLSTAGTIAAAGPPTLVLGYTNGYLGYLPDRAAYRDPDYEVLASPVRPGSAEAVAAAVRALDDQEAP